MEDYKKEFIEFMVNSNVLTFGEFVTKSGRNTPFFINTGNYDSGEQLDKLGKFYAQTICSNLKAKAFHLFGPAYKGIPLVAATSMKLQTEFDVQSTFTFNRKETKDHGEGGNLVGYKFQDQDEVTIIEDVTTSGASIYETVPIIKQVAKVDLKALVVSVDRMEKGKGDRSALVELEEAFGIETFSIVNLDEVVNYLLNREINGRVVLTEDHAVKIEEYRKTYGAKV